MQGFNHKPQHSASSPHAAIYDTFSIQRHLIRRTTLRLFAAEAMRNWNDAAAA
jgi:putative transposase